MTTDSQAYWDSVTADYPPGNKGPFDCVAKTARRLDYSILTPREVDLAIVSDYTEVEDLGGRFAHCIGRGQTYLVPVSDVFYTLWVRCPSKDYWASLDFALVHTFGACHFREGRAWTFGQDDPWKKTRSF